MLGGVVQPLCVVQERKRGGTLGALTRLHLSPIIWGIIIGMLTLLAYCVIRNPAFPPASQAS